MAIKKDFGATSVGLNSFVTPIIEEDATTQVIETPATTTKSELSQKTLATTKATKKASLKKVTIYFAEEDLADFDLISRFYGKSRNELAMEFIKFVKNTRDFSREMNWRK